MQIIIDNNKTISIKECWYKNRRINQAWSFLYIQSTSNHVKNFMKNLQSIHVSTSQYKHNNYPGINFSPVSWEYISKSHSTPHIIPFDFSSFPSKFSDSQKSPPLKSLKSPLGLQLVKQHLTRQLTIKRSLLVNILYHIRMIIKQ